MQYGDVLSLIKSAHILAHNNIEKVITPHDNRYKIIKLTSRSIAMKQVMIQKLKQAEQIILKGFTSEEKEQLALFLSRIVQNMSSHITGLGIVIERDPATLARSLFITYLKISPSVSSIVG